MKRRAPARKQAASRPAPNASNSGKGKRAKLLDWDAVDAEGSESENEERNEAVAAAAAKRAEEGEAELRETADEKRLRIAKQYLRDVEAEVHEDELGSDDEEERESAPLDRVGARLEHARKEATGTLRRNVAAELAGSSIDAESIRHLGGHELSVTCVAMAGDDRTALSGSKDNSVLQWDVETAQRVATLRPRWKRGKGPQSSAAKTHAGEILAVAASTDGRYAAAGGRDRLVRVWDLRNGELLQSFTGHRDAVSGLAFRIGSATLYSCSHDRSVKHWDLSALGYVETLYGHQAPINAVAAWRKERAVTAGSDRTLRLWKVAEGSHALFHSPGFGGTDCVAALDDDFFIGGGQDCALTLWSAAKKRPIAVSANAHGPNRWLTSLAALQGSDLVASGSSDGQLRLWRVQGDKKVLEQVAAAPLPGFVNGLAIATTGRFVVAAVGQEHRLGRWERIPAGKNRLCIVPLPCSGSSDHGASGAAGSLGGAEP